MQSHYVRVAGKNDWKYLVSLCTFVAILMATTVNWNSFAFGPW
jgi:hypothetical protein